MTEKRFNDKPTKVTAKGTDAAVILDYEAMVTPPEGGAPIPSLKKVFFNRFARTMCDGMFSAEISEDNPAYKGVWALGTTYNYGDIVQNNVTTGVGDLPLYFICGADGVVGATFEPCLDLSGDKGYVWSVYFADGGLHVGPGPAGAQGVTLTQGAVAGGSGCLVGGIDCVAGKSYDAASTYMYRGEWVVGGTYYENETVIVAPPLPLPAVIHRCLKETNLDQISAGTYALIADLQAAIPSSTDGTWATVTNGGSPTIYAWDSTSGPAGAWVDTGTANESWEIVRTVLAWDAVTTFSDGSYIYTEDTINEVPIICVFRVAAFIPGAIATKPDFKKYEVGATPGATGYTIDLILSEDHYSVTSNESKSVYAFIPTKPIVYKLSGNGPGSTHRSEACLTSLGVWNGDSSTRLAIIVFPEADDNTAGSFGMSHIASNAAFGIWELYIMGLVIGFRDFDQIFGMGSLNVGFMNNAKGHSNQSFGFAVQNRNVAAFASGANASTEWLGERVHSSGSVADTSILSTSAVFPITSDLNLSGTASYNGAKALLLVDPIGRLLAGRGVSQNTTVPELNSDMTGNESIVYNVKATVTGRVDNSMELAVYEGDFIIDMSKSGEYRLIDENWTQKYADALAPVAAWVTPAVDLGVAFDELGIYCVGIGVAGGHVHWSANLRIDKHIVAEYSN